jgi:fatty acid-binding protein DegV
VEKLRIRPILRIDPKGKLVMAGRALGVRRAIRWLTEAVGRIRTDFTQTTVAIGYTMKKEIAEEIARRLSALYKMGNIIFYKAGSAIGAHTGPGAGAVFFEA